MAYHLFNIGKPAVVEWWRQNLQRGVITAGFLGDEGDRGEVILQGMDEGDTVIAYVNGHGFVGAGLVQGAGTYHLHKHLPRGSLSDHLHERKVAWTLALPEVAQAIKADHFGRQAPRNTKERLPDVAEAERIIEALRANGARDLSHGLTLRGQDIFWRAADAALTLSAREGRSVTADEVRQHIRSIFPDYKRSNALSDLSLVTVNDRNRGFHGRVRSSSELRSDLGHPHDLLYRSRDARKNPVYEAYDLERHGVWALYPDHRGQPRLVEPGREVTLAEAALEEAREEIAAEPVEPITSDHDGRKRVMREIVAREGQGDFREGLLAAYGRCCAVTGCAVEDILEAAHIRPYRGEHTHRTDNGLLLRADIHTLLDKGLIWIDETGRVQMAERLAGSEYEQWRGQELRLPASPSCRPHADHLAYHRTTTAGQPA
jgi:hypothetical protein